MATFMNQPLQDVEEAMLGAYEQEMAVVDPDAPVDGVGNALRESYVRRYFQ
ncbi:hypothetical protein Pmar_PMAR024711 [Perkinsus marinus ATCC 50983]|uniref:Uncharacterized protein n=1 Tax=Perkinsus marinus (strain ATCC 50983 / TXsc) TaxID=423536 RepID=C5M139_PERM5|nr:hypothetical protein Pmar_PMAR024711 [Perkinsus marinus ATCC 50983]EEQ97269.1 hypothetical protein Pmar_PMAR024711 [Perkinsus marinus ATCC 50983]|eukprot:XP_002764552.1 hypothetical protein Pmar_PMAR024711 [Perkinsus marinus ATCC 50983]